MLRKKANLPMSTGGKSPTPPRRQMDMPDMTPATVFSITWVLSSLALVGIGYLHCNSHREQSRLYCVEDVCTLTRDSPDNRSGLEVQFLRENLVKAEVVHMDKKGDLVLGNRASRKQKRKMSQTYTVTWKDGESQATTTLPIAQYNLGRKTPKAKVTEVMKYVKKQIDELDVKEQRWLTGIGMVCYVFGGLLLILRVAIGSLVAQPLSRRDLAARRKLFK